MLCNKIKIRTSKSSDLKPIKSLERTAFGRQSESKLVEDLLSAPDQTISLVAVCDGKIIGHILLSKIKASVEAMALAPLAVSAEYREMQVGSQLVREAIWRARKNGSEAIFVLGDVLYYERFGFSSKAADPFKVKWQSRQFMALELVEGCLQGKSGVLVYPDAFALL